MWAGNHTMKTGASFTYDVTEQLFQPLQNGRYTFRGFAERGAESDPVHAVVRIGPRGAADVPEGVRARRVLPGRLARAPNLTLNLGLRYDVEIIKDIPDWPAGTDKNNFDPRIGFAWDPKGDQKWAVRGGVGRFTQQHPIFTIVKGGVGGRNGQVTVNLTPSRPAVSDLPEHAAGVSAGSRAAGAQHPGDFA